MRLAIDIGTHTARAAYLDHEQRPRLVTFPSGRTHMAALARQTFTGLVVGDEAAQTLIGNEETTISGCTRLMGRARMLDARMLERLPFQVREIGGEAWCNLLYDEVRVGDVYGRIAAELIAAAQRELRESVDSVVLCIPGSAEDRFRIQARAAVEACGVHVQRLINQPAAAVLAFGAHHVAQPRIHSATYAVVACSGSATEVSIVRRTSQGIRTLATCGDVMLGGDDIVWAAAGALNQRIQIVNGVDVFGASQSRAGAYGLRSALEEAFGRLAVLPEATMTLDHGAGFGRDIVTTVTRNDATAWTAPLLERIGDLCRRAGDAAGTPPSHIDQVVLIGEWAWLPGIASTVAASFERLVGTIQVENAGELAVIGAALAGASDAPSVWDVTPYPLGINCYYGDRELFSPIIAANTSIPTPAAGQPGAFGESYQTRYPNQTSVTISVLQYRGDRNPDPYANPGVYPGECETLGTWEWTGLRPRRGQHASFTVTFSVDADGILHLFAREKDTGTSLQVQIEGGIG